MAEICQKALPVKPWREERTRRLPGISPVAPGEWLVVDDAYAAQIAHKARLVAAQGDKVLRLEPSARPAAGELLERILDELGAIPGFAVGARKVRCPDGRVVTVDRNHPLETCSKLVQEDLILLQKPEGADEHVLTGALLGFPASWMLAEKYLKPLTMIHTPVPEYAGDIARRVQRLFDGIQPDRPMWRANFLTYGDPELHQPRTEADKRPVHGDGLRWMRVERQCLLRLPRTRAVVFSIHTFVVPWARLDSEDRDLLQELCA
ncbi:DUF3445 domain-containing protein [Aliiroseovarius sp.]|uniref:heme-dependent oxidative N-demethylase family protein n=1 Tax=Aliiroseovarius sp. TaxID=1872442 RepID=UPI0026117771|nr:DUF3445 domain-containing protein [Aliiroseovarius sp.]